MEDTTPGIILVTIIGLLYFIGIGSLILSFIYDPKEPSSYTNDNSERPSVVSSYRSLVSEEEEIASVIVDADDSPPSFDFDFNEH